MSEENRQSGSDKKKESEEIISVLGGVEVEIEYRPIGKEKKGKKDRVKVRELGADEMLHYNGVIDFEGSTVELFCDRPKGWANTITHASLEKILQVGEDDVGNLKFWSGWRARQAARTNKLMPGTMDLMEQALKKILSSRSPDSSSQSPSATTSQSR